MGKKKKLQRGQKEKKPTPIPTTNTTPIESANNGDEASSLPVVVTSVNNRDSTMCSHIEKGINLDFLSSKICPTDSMKCNDCGGGKSSRVKGKKGAKSETKSIWVCLECANFSCGGVGMPNTPQSHAVRHSRQSRHSLAVHYVNHQLIFCFKCSRLVAGRKSEEFGVHKEVLSEVAKRMKSGESESVDVEDVWFGSGKIGTKMDYSVTSSSSNVGDGKGYGVRGLVNLGNTCFFNSVLQNLLALDSLRDYFVNKMDASVGPLSASLKKLFLETGGEGVVKGVINPRALFGNVCTKAPMFKGFQQQDSHELLRFLMDGLSNEELKARKRAKGEEGVASSKEPTFVDVIFGGKLASIVTCLECGDSSTSYEPFLDLSLSFPTKKSQNVKTQPVTRGKKPKLPPRRSGRIRNKNTRDLRSFPVGSVSENSTGVSDKSVGGNSSGEMEPRVQEAEQSSLPSCDPFWSDTADADSMVLDMGLTPQELSGFQDPPWSDETDANAMALDMGLTPQDFLAIQNPQGDLPRSDAVDLNVKSEEMGLTSQDLSTIQSPENTQPDSANDSWMDYVVPTTVSTKIDIDWDQDPSLQLALEYSLCSNLEHVVSEKEQNDMSDSFERLDFVDPTPISNEIGVGLETDEVIVDQSTSEDVLHNHVSPIILGHGTRSDSESADAEASLDNANQLQSDSLERGTVAHHQAGVSVNEDDKNQISLSNSAQFNADLVHTSASCDQLRSDSSNNDNENPCQEPEVVEGPVTKEDMSLKVQVSNGDTDSSSAVINNEQDSSSFGLGDMFNEPESTTEVRHVANDPIVISSDSDPGEVDNSNAPVSVETCLYHFIEPEHLSKDEHARECDNCSKILREQIVKAKTKPQTSGLEILPNDCDGRNGVVDTSPQTSELQHDRNPMPETELNAITCQPETEVHDEINGGHDTCDPEPIEEDANSKKLKVSRDATKRLFISSAPSILTITLKRFCQDARGRTSKLNGHVIFKDTIDLKPYMDPRCTDKDSYTYQLVGVVEHSGTMRGGHYVAYVRGGTTSGGSCAWYNISDMYVRQVSMEEVLASEAYILFYERI